MCHSDFITRQRKNPNLPNCGGKFHQIYHPQWDSIGEYSGIFYSWKAMKSRVLYKKSKDYANYGGRGIKIDPRFMDYEYFKSWSLSNGWNRDLTIDRIDPNKNYCPENCRWVNSQIQALNKRSSYQKYVGIYACGKKWRAIVKRSGKSYYLGTYEDKDEALRMRNEFLENHTLSDFNKISK